MGLKINGSTSGSIEIDVPAAVGSDVTGVLLPSAAGTLDRLERTGNILQVVTASTSTTTTISTDTFSDTGLSASITPSSTSSRILIFVNQNVRIDRDNNSCFGNVKILRDSTAIHTGVQGSGGGFDYGFSHTASGNTVFRTRATYILVDSPSTTSAITYKTQGNVNTTTNNADAIFQESGSTQNGTSYITLMEIA